jgi:large subunit ribosomal protein L20
MRISYSVPRRRAKKRLFHEAKGRVLGRRKLLRIVKETVVRARVTAYRDRRNRKRDFRSLWITRITAAANMRGISYSRFIHGLSLAGISLNRKMLSELAITEPKVFDQICEQAVQNSLAGKAGVPSTPRAKTGGAAAVPAKSHAKPAAASGGDIIDIEGIGPKYREQLAKAGISWIKELRAEGKTKAGRASIAEKSGIAEALILTWVNMADLLRIKGVDANQAELLEASGVDTVKELAHRVPANLAAKMAETNADKKVAPRVPSESEVAGWVEQAKGMAPGVEH